MVVYGLPCRKYRPHNPRPSPVQARSRLRKYPKDKPLFSLQHSAHSYSIYVSPWYTRARLSVGLTITMTGANAREKKRFKSVVTDGREEPQQGPAHGCCPAFTPPFPPSVVPPGWAEGWTGCIPLPHHLYVAVFRRVSLPQPSRDTIGCQSRLNLGRCSFGGRMRSPREQRGTRERGSGGGRAWGTPDGSGRRCPGPGSGAVACKSPKKGSTKRNQRENGNAVRRGTNEKRRETETRRGNEEREGDWGRARVSLPRGPFTSTIGVGRGFLQNCSKLATSTCLEWNGIARPASNCNLGGTMGGWVPVHLPAPRAGLPRARARLQA